MTNFIDRVRELISKGDLEEAFILLKDKNSNFSRELKDAVIIQESRFQRLKKNIRNGIISLNETNVSTSRISLSILTLLNAIEQDEILRKENEQVKTLGTARVIVIPTPNITENIEYQLQYFFLEFVQTKKKIPILSANFISTQSVAKYLVKKLFPQYHIDDYQWFLELNGNTLPPNHTIYTSGIKNGSYVNLVGKHFAPSIKWFNE